MKLNLVEALLLIALDDEKGTFLPDSTKLTYSLGGAILLELALQHRIEFEDEKVRVLSTTALRDQYLQLFLEDIAKNSKVKKISFWVERFGMKTGKLKRQMIARFVEQGILAKREERFLWIFTNKKYPTQNHSVENAVKAHLREVVAYETASEERDAFLLSLVDMCKLNEEVFGGAAENTNIQQRIKQIIAEAEESKSIYKAVKTIEDAITTALMVSTMTATNSTMVL